MSVDYKKFLPKQMRDTRWGELLEVVQDIIENEVKPTKIRPIFDQFDVEKASDQELLNYANYFGYNILSLTGLSSTHNYLKKQISTIVPKIKYKTTYNCFPYVGVPYGLSAKAHNTIYDYSNNSILTLENIEDAKEYVLDPVTTFDWGSPNIIYYIDKYYSDYTELTFDENEYDVVEFDTQEPVYYGDNPNPNPDLTFDDLLIPTWDMTLSLNMISRVFVFSYKFNFVENENEFLSIYSLKSLDNDIQQCKRATDFVYYEPILEVETNSGSIVETKCWKDFTGLGCVNQYSIYMGSGNLQDVRYINLGNGTYDEINSGITDVQSFTKQFDYSGCIWSIEEDNHIMGRPYITASGIISEYHFDDITEMSCLDENSGCILYSTFPTISWGQDLKSNIKFDIQLV